MQTADKYYKKRPFHVCICRNKLKEEIKANTIQRVIGLQAVYPVKHVSGIRYDGNEARDGGENFQQALEAAKEKRMEKESRRKPVKNHSLEMMGGMNQYDRHAREVFYAMSSEADYKC